MADADIDVFVSSDLRRSAETCRIIAEPHGLPVTATPLLRERDWGSFTGMYIPDLKDVPWPDDIESVDDIRKRAKEFLDYLRAAYPGKTVLAVGHGIINKAIQSVYFDKAMKDIAPMKNAEVRVLIIFLETVWGSSGADSR